MTQLQKEFLVLQIRELQDRAEAARRARQRDVVRAQVGRLTSFLVLLAAYGLLLGVASRVLVLSAMVDPASLANAAGGVAQVGSSAVASIPGALQGTLISALTAFALFVFGGTSSNIRSDLGGLVFVGVTMLSLLGIAAAAFTGTFGILLALPGLVAAIVIVGELCWMLVRMQQAEALTAVRPEEKWSPARWSSRLLTRCNERLSPSQKPLVMVAFAAVPALCLAAVAGAVWLNGGLLYTPAFVSRFVAMAWCLWAIVVTPAAARIPIWGGLVWGGLIAAQLSAFSVSYLFALAVAALVYVDVVWLVLAPRQTGLPSSMAAQSTARPSA
ncbi:MAG: hypothetical protein M3024_04615 [Candidatus Dormibacteraeota bacterium]|nr:hypothetical protein [Candidatus Dormibacteraeota bacterium]MDQ6900250.1 hypothetical protein [Candidatus Dormibacteraeota bacterium]